jgi:hypothetical protein
MNENQRLRHREAYENMGQLLRDKLCSEEYAAHHFYTVSTDLGRPLAVHYLPTIQR